MYVLNDVLCDVLSLAVDENTLYIVEHSDSISGVAENCMRRITLNGRRGI